MQPGRHRARPQSIPSRSGRDGGRHRRPGAVTAGCPGRAGAGLCPNPPRGRAKAQPLIAALAGPCRPGAAMGEAAAGSAVPPLPAAEAAGGQVNALTVLALLEKLVSMLEAVEGNQRQMEQRQRGLEGAVRGIQADLVKLCRSHGATGETVEKLLEKSRKVCAHTRAVRERLDRQCDQVRRLEQHHAQLLRRDRFKVLIFQVRACPGRSSAPHRGDSPVLLAGCQLSASSGTRAVCVLTWQMWEENISTLANVRKE